MNKINLTNNIINNQLLANNVTNIKIIEIFRSVDKSQFVEEEDKTLANMDENFFFNKKRFMLKNSTLAKLFDLIIDKKIINALNIGSATGFSSVLLSKFVDFVVSIENDKSLHEKEKKIIKHLDIENINSINLKLESGCREFMPYDLIFINGCLLNKPKILLDQLNNNGCLLDIELTNNNLKKIVKYEKNHNNVLRKEYFVSNTPML